MPTRKVAAGGIAGALTTLVVALSNWLGGPEIDANTAAALTTVFSFIAAYAVRERGSK